MKIAVLVVDEHGLVHTAATRAPDQYRRSIAAATGRSARLAFVGLPPGSMSAEAWLDRVLAPLADTRVPPPSPPATFEGIRARCYRVPVGVAVGLLAKSLAPRSRLVVFARRIRRMLANAVRRVRRRSPFRRGGRRLP